MQGEWYLLEYAGDRAGTGRSQNPPKMKTLFRLTCLIGVTLAAVFLLQNTFLLWTPFVQRGWSVTKVKEWLRPERVSGFVKHETEATTQWNAPWTSTGEQAQQLPIYFFRKEIGIYHISYQRDEVQDTRLVWNDQG